MAFRAGFKKIGRAYLLAQQHPLFVSREDFAAWAKGKRQLRMGVFYQKMRPPTNRLLDGSKWHTQRRQLEL